MSQYRDQEGRCSEAGPLYWNRSAALEIVGGDELLLDEVVQMFLVESPRLVRQIERALLHHDLPTLELAAHSLKGELGYLAVPAASEAAQKLENAGQTGDLQDVEDAFAELRALLEGLWSALAKRTGA